MQNSIFNNRHSIFHIPYSIFKWFTKTRRRKILSSILSILLVLTTFRFIFIPPKETEAAIIEKSSSSTDTTNSATFNDMTTMTDTPGAGTYLLIFSATIAFTSAGPADETVDIIVREGGTELGHTQRTWRAEDSVAQNDRWPIGVAAKVAPGASEAVDIYWRVSSGTVTVYDRIMVLIPVDSGDIFEATQVPATTDTETSATNTLMADMIINNPGAGDYVAIYSGTMYVEASTTATAGFVLYEGGTEVAHSDRLYQHEGSMHASMEQSMMTAAEVTLSSGTDDIEVRWRRTAGSGTPTVAGRTLVAVKSDSINILEASAEGNHTDTSASFETLDSLTFSTPASGTYVAIATFSADSGAVDIDGDNVTDGAFHVAGTEEADTRRTLHQDSSFNDTEFVHFSTGVVNPNGSQDVDYRWRGDQATNRIAHDRTMLLLSEPSGFNVSGTFHGASESGGDPGQCDGSTENLTLRVDGLNPVTTSCANTSGIFTFTGVSASANNTITIFSTGVDKANRVYVSDGTVDANMDLYEDTLIVGDENDGTVTIPDLGDYDSTDEDTHLLFDVTGTTLTTESGVELHIHTSDKFDPGGDVDTNATGGDIHIDDSGEMEIDNASSTVGRDVLVDGAATFDVQTNVAISGGDITTSGTSAIVTYTGTPAVTISGSGSIGGGTTPSITFYDLTISGTQTMASATDTDHNLTVNGTMNGSASVTTEINGDLVGTGFVTMTGGTVEQRVAATELFGTTSGSNAWTFINLTLSRSSGTAVIDTNTGGSGGITISGQLLVSKSGDGAGTTLQAGNRTWTLSNSNSGTPFDADQASGTLTAETSVFAYTGDNDGGNVTVDNSTYNDVNFGGGTAESYVLEGATTAGNDLTINANGTLDTGSDYGITVTGSWANNGTFTANSGAVTMNDADGSETLTGTMTGSSSFYDLIFNDGAASGAWTFAANSATVSRDFTITGGTVTAPSTTLIVGRNFTNSDGFTHNSGTVSFNTTTASTLEYTSNTSFYDLSISAAGKQVDFDAAQQTIIVDNGSLTIQGTNCSSGLIYLDSVTDDDAWDLNVSTTGTTVDIDYSDVEDSNSTNAITADNSSEVNGGNTNWTVDAACELQDTNIRGNTNLRGNVNFR